MFRPGITPMVDRELTNKTKNGYISINAGGSVCEGAGGETVHRLWTISINPLRQEPDS